MKCVLFCFKKVLFILCVCEYMHICLYTTCMGGIYGDQEHELNLSAEAYIQPWQCFEVDDCKARDF